MSDRSQWVLDDIDRVILGILANDPRTPYADISSILQNEGHEMSSEGIRNRVQRLFDMTSTFFMLRPETHNWHVLRLSITITDSEGAKERVMNYLEENHFWFLSRGFGSFDIYAIASAPSLDVMETVLTDVRSLGDVVDVRFFIETQRAVDMDMYFPMEWDE